MSVLCNMKYFWSMFEKLLRTSKHFWLLIYVSPFHYEPLSNSESYSQNIKIVKVKRFNIIIHLSLISFCCDSSPALEISHPQPGDTKPQNMREFYQSHSHSLFTSQTNKIENLKHKVSDVEWKLFYELVINCSMLMCSEICKASAWSKHPWLVHVCRFNSSNY